MKTNTCGKIKVCIIAFFVCSLAMAQLFVGSNSYVINNNELVYVQQDIELQTSTSNFYLRNEGQLIQGTTGVGANKGNGNLSVFQEGNANNFQFNYWCSPVGNSETLTSENNHFGIKQLGVPTSITETIPAIILASNIYDGTASPLKIAPYWVYKFTNKTTYSDWTQAGSTMTIAPGEGFTMKGSSGTNLTTINGVKNNPDGNQQRYDFRGKPNDGTISIPVLPGELTLTGNPYPSAINLQDFLNNEPSCTGIAYFWQQDKTQNSHFIADYKGGYATYSGANIYVPAPFYQYDGSGNASTTLNSKATLYERKYAPIGQGFMIKGLIKGSVQMKNKYRVFVTESPTHSSQFEKKSNSEKTSNADTTSLIRFNTLLNNGPISQTVLAFNSQYTDGIDRSKDALSLHNNPANVYFIISGKEYVINSMAFDINKKIPIGFRNLATANYKITVNEIVNLPEVENIYLHDKTTDLYHDIKNSFYELNIAAGTNNTRYEITFKNNTLNIDEVLKKELFLFQNNDEKMLKVNNPTLKKLNTLILYDIAGRIIFEKKDLGNEPSIQFSTSNLNDGIYIVKLTAENQQKINQKIIVKK
jgi:hypothetical protein